MSQQKQNNQDDTTKDITIKTMTQQKHNNQDNETAHDKISIFGKH